MSLLGDVILALEGAHIAHALIGAAAMALHGVSRATADIDLFTIDQTSLRRDLWIEIENKGATIRLLKGDLDDPLAGSVRLSIPNDQTVDVVVGRYAWQAEIIEMPWSLEAASREELKPASLSCSVYVNDVNILVVDPRAVEHNLLTIRRPRRAQCESCNCSYM